MGALWIFVAIVVISALVGAVAQVLNKLNEQQNQARRENVRRGEGGAVRQSSNDIDRFLAEIDRLRRRTADGGAAAAPPPARPVRPQPPQRPRVVAEPVEPRRVEPAALPIARVIAPPPAAAPSPILTEPQSAPAAAPVQQVATVTALPPSLSAPVVPRAILGRKPRGVTAHTRFGKDLAALLGSGNGVAMAVVLQEILGPPKGRSG